MIGLVIIKAWCTGQTNYVEGKNHRGRPRLAYIEQIIKNRGCYSYKEMKQKENNREERRLLQSNLWVEYKKKRVNSNIFNY